MQSVVSSQFNLLKQTKNVLGSKNNNFHFFAILKSFNVHDLKQAVYKHACQTMD